MKNEIALKVQLTERYILAGHFVPIKLINEAL